MKVSKLVNKKYKSACHVLALVGLADEKTGKEIDRIYTDLSNAFAMPESFKLNGYDKDFVKSLLDSRVIGLDNKRTHFIAHLAFYFGLKTTTKSQKSEPVFRLCAGYAGNNVTPEHMWLYFEDTKDGVDTFPSIDFVRIAKTTINHPPSEHSAFNSVNVASVPVYGFTKETALVDLLNVYNSF